MAAHRVMTVTISMSFRLAIWSTYTHPYSVPGVMNNVHISCFSFTHEAVCTMTQLQLGTRNITTSTLHNPISPTTLPKHLPQIRHNRLRPLPCRKVPAPLMLALKHHIPLRPRPCLWKHPQLPRKMGEPDLDIRDVLSRPVLGDLLRPILPPIMHRFVIDPHARRGAGRAEPVDRAPDAHFVGRP